MAPSAKCLLVRFLRSQAHSVGNPRRVLGLTLGAAFGILPSMPTTSRRAKNKARTRDALIASATTLFRVHGYEATTIDQIAAGAGVSRRTYFRYFPSKDAVVFPRAEERLERFRELLVPEGDETLSETLLRACREIGRDFSFNWEELVLQQRLIETEPLLQARERDLDQGWEVAIAAALRARGRDEVSAQVLGGALMGALRAVFRLWTASEEPRDLESLGAEALTLITSLDPPRGAPR